jgi:hypothetical protein
VSGPALSEARVLAEACARTGLDDFGPADFREPLRRLLAALAAEACLSEAGLAAQRERVVGLLANRLRAENAIARHPEILEERLAPALAIVGLARTGTTLLHRMLASDSRWLALRWWEARQPAPWPGSESAPQDPRIADAEREVEAMLGASPDLLAAHPMDAQAPDEDILLIEHAFRSTVPEAFAVIPRFGEWLEAQDPAPAYAYLVRMLRLLQWQKRRRGEPGRRWLLKTPFHLGNLDALFAALPGTRVVLTHRDPRETIPSFASLNFTLAQAASPRVEARAVGRIWSGKMQRALARALAARERHPERFLDICYADLVANPLAQVERIYGFAGEELTAATRAAMRAWSEENARDRRPVHAYTLAEFGFSDESIRRDFAPYTRLLESLEGRSGA